MGADPRHAWLAALALALVTAFGVATTLDSVAYAPGADEGYYLAYTERVSDRGLTDLPNLFHDYVEQPRHHRFPNPLRVGYFAIASAWSALRGEASFRGLSELSLIFHAASVLVAFALARRALGPATGLAAAALVACSPLLLAMSRRAHVDALATLTGMAVLLAAFTWLREPNRRGNAIALAATLGLALLVKETSVLLLLPCVVALAAIAGRSPEAMPSAASLSLAAALPVAVALGVWTVAAGGVGPLLATVEIILRSPDTNPYAVQFGGGPWYRPVIDFLLLSPLPTLLAIASLGALPFALRSADAPTRQLLGFLVAVVVSLLLAYAFFTKNVRYVAVLELPLRVFAAWAWVGACARLAPSARVPVGVAGVALLCVLDLVSFHAIFVEGGLYDPVSAGLLEARGLVPSP